MPNWFYLLVNICYLLALSLWVGGAVALGAFVAPILFRNLPRSEAGALFGPMLRRFARVRLIAILVAIVAAGVKHFVWETHVVSVWMLLRWLALGLMAASVLYEILHLEGAIELTRKDLSPDQGNDDPSRAPFQKLHRRSEGLMKVGLVAAVVALFLS
jgi:hypothetical protein